MGMDIHGICPVVRGEAPTRPENLWEDKKPQPTRKEIDKYFEQKNAYEEKNAGIYFRNNVWWWRPLGALIEEKCKEKEWFTKEHADALQSNGGLEWSSDEAIEIGMALQSCVDTGECDERERDYKRKAKVSRAWNKKVQIEMDKIEEQVKKTKGKDVVPFDFPPDAKKKWDELYATKSWDDSYPFDTDNVKKFIRFLRECGGFQIC